MNCAPPNEFVTTQYNKQFHLNLIMLTSLCMEFWFMRHADYGSIGLVTLNMDVAGTWVIDPLERPRVNYTQNTHFLRSSFIIHQCLSLSLSLSTQYHCMYRANYVAFFFNFLPKIYAALNRPGAQKEIPCCRRKLHLPETKQKSYYFHYFIQYHLHNNTNPLQLPTAFLPLLHIHQ